MERHNEAFDKLYIKIPFSMFCKLLYLVNVRIPLYFSISIACFCFNDSGISNTL